MKSLLLTSLLLISPLALANPLLGSWEFVEGKYAVEEGFVSAKAPELTSIKLVTTTHFNYITQKDGKFHYAGGGNYTLKNQKFVETFAYGNIPSLLGKTMVFDYKIEGNLWHHSLTENGKLIEAEIWRKID